MRTSEKPVQMVLVPEGYLTEIVEKLDRINEKLDARQTGDITHDSEPTAVKRPTRAQRGTFDYLTINEVTDILQVSKQTLQTYRRRKIIPFVKFGNKIRYRRSDIDNYLSENIIK